MSDSNQAIELAKSIHTALNTNIFVQNILGDPPRLYDHVPADPIYPYLTYGPMRSEDVGGDMSPMTTHTLTLHIWSRYSGRAEILNGLAIITDVFETGSLQLDTAELISAHVVFNDNFRAPDGRTLHGLIRLQVTTQPLTE
ncbi:MAG: DUF3168 domain-containing protein [Robiginitomaculum sp.]|nr:DUF3168 domain-containing protein [Robiginitomaculum sp.]